MAGTTGIFRDLTISFRNDDIFRVVADGESQAVVEAVDCFGCVLSGKIMGSMAIVAGGPGPVAAFEPARILFLHDVAIGAGLTLI